MLAFLSQTIGHLAIQQVDNALPTLDIVTISWSSLMSTFEWSGRNDQLAKVKVRASRAFVSGSLDRNSISSLFLQAFLPVLESFCKKPMDQVNLINIVQVYCYDEQKMMKSFPSLVRVSPSLLPHAPLSCPRILSPCPRAREDAC